MMRVCLTLLLLLAHGVAHVSEDSLAAFRDSAKVETGEALPNDMTEVTCEIRSDDPEGPQGSIVFVLREDWSPHACDAFRTRVEAKFYDGLRFFRVLPHFIAQFGFNPAWDGPKWDKVKRDERHADALNKRGTAAFAGSSKTQIFVNTYDNKFLDKEGTAFAQVRNVALLDQLYGGYKEGSGQIKAYNRGTDALMAEFPKMSHIETCRVTHEGHHWKRALG